LGACRGHRRRVGRGNRVTELQIGVVLALNGVMYRRWPDQLERTPWNFAIVGHGQAW
jgi:hypothetical protein